ncbi:MAG: adenosine deaminase family protein, partial [Solobacterium sp.]|nr:adenosine deaminase family protein [Solobacterium sp.]
DGFRKFQLTCSVLQTKEALAEAAYRLVRKLNEKGMIYAEIRFASQQHTQKGLTQLEALQAVIDGAKKGMDEFPGIRIGIINCLMHKGDSAAYNMAQNEETIQASAACLGKGLVGIDLAGYENNAPYMDYAPLFALAKSYGIPCTAHAGEMGVASHVLDALEIGVDRIGHGIDSVKDEEILRRVVETQIPLEVCVTGNCRHGLLYAEHPVRTLLERGAYVTLNCDNMLFAQTDLINEHAQLRHLGVETETLKECTRRAIRAAFCTEEEKQELLTKAEEIMNEE